MISIHALREEGDTDEPSRLRRRADFYPRPPRGGRLASFTTCWSVQENFYPRPPRGGRQVKSNSRLFTREFLSTPSARRATMTNGDVLGAIEFLSTPSARRATNAVNSVINFFKISIHALREEGDMALSTTSGFETNFYPRPPRGGRQGNTAALSVTTIFLSTPSARRATTALRAWK